MELKDAEQLFFASKGAGKVPNLPCGVESYPHNILVALFEDVPNLPCGVERYQCNLQKESRQHVPNLPCGVERSSLCY